MGTTSSKSPTKSPTVNTKHIVLEETPQSIGDCIERCLDKKNWKQCMHTYINTVESGATMHLGTDTWHKHRDGFVEIKLTPSAYDTIIRELPKEVIADVCEVLAAHEMNPDTKKYLKTLPKKGGKRARRTRRMKRSLHLL